MHRALTADEQVRMTSILDRYAEAVAAIPNMQIDAVEGCISGDRTSLETACYLLYEGIDEAIGEGLLSEALPLLVLKCLASEFGTSVQSAQVGNRWEYAVFVADLGAAVTTSALSSGHYVREWDYDETPTAYELALDSFEVILEQAMRKRIFGGNDRRQS